MSGQKAALGTNLINGATVSADRDLHIDRLDDRDLRFAYGPYFNIWVTDGLGHYAVIANEPSNPEWAPAAGNRAELGLPEDEALQGLEDPGCRHRPTSLGRTPSGATGHLTSRTSPT
ncbi:MAG: hypothetical protein IPP62_07380 [bacterium]|nr:hypothetical protein [bacterium]